MSRRRRHTIFLSYLLFLAAALLFSDASAQQKTRIQVLHADTYNYNAKLGKNIQRLVGNVRLRQDSTLFFSDSAFLNDKKRNFNAFGHVHITVNDTLNIYGDRMHYNGKTKVAELFGHVKLKDNKATLNTEHLIYNRTTHIASYDIGGTIHSDTNVLSSTVGRYNTKTRIFYFQKNVVLNSPGQLTHSDTLIYNTNNAVAYIKGLTTIKSKESTIICSDGWLDTRNHRSKLFHRPIIQTKNQTLTADSIFYNNQSTHGRAFGKIRIIDTTRQLIIEGQVGEMWNQKGITYVTDSAVAISYNYQDSLFMHADTLWMYFDKKRNAEKMLAYHQVRFYRKDLQGVCDSLVYTMKDSTMRMFTRPIIWAGENQLSSDSIDIVIKNNEVDTMTMINNAFIISRDSTRSYNQVKGRDMIGYFRNNKIYQMKVNGNAQSIYWLRNNNQQLLGINKAESGEMLIKITNNKIVGINYLDQISETLFPPKKLSENKRFLEGFDWRNKLRPRSKEDIFIRKAEKP